MTIPKWLIPVISIVAGVALAVTATLVGVHFASTDVKTSPSKTSTAPLYSPVDGKGLSTTAGTFTGTLPGTPPTPMTASRQQLINDVLHSADPAATIREETTGDTGGSSSSSDGSGAAADTTPAPAGDDCSPSSGATPPGCPDGIHGAIYASHMLPSFWMNAIAFPHATSTNSSAPRCAANSTPGQVTIGTSSSEPANFTVTYWPTSTPTDRQVATFETQGPQLTTFDNYYNGTATGASPTEYSCKVLTVDPTVGYTAQVTAIDGIYRIAPTVTLLFNGGGLPTIHPELESYVGGGNLLFASALHSPDESVQIKAVQRTAGAANCDAPAAFPQWRLTGNVTVSASYLNDHRILPADNRRLTVSFVVPEGTDFLLCARWYPNSHAVWGRTVPTYESRQSMSSPDMLLPVVTMTSIAPDSGDLKVTASFNSAAGIACGPDVVWDPARGHTGGLTMPLVVCDSSLYGDSSNPDALWDTAGDSILRFQFDVDLGPESSPDRPDGYFPLAHSCVGDCTIPAPQTYRLPLFDGPNRATDGSITLVVSYRQGNHNGAAGWVTGSTQGIAAGFAPAGTPAFDTDALSEPGPIDYAHLSSSAILPITSDRPVDYTVTARENDGVLHNGSVVNCLRFGTGTATGHLDAPGNVTVAGLCLGASYQLEVTLTDAHGLSSIWGVYGTDPSGWWPVGSSIGMPRLPGTIRYDFRAEGPNPGQIVNLSVGVGGATMVDSHGYLNGTCRDDGMFNQQGATPNVLLSQNTALYIHYRALPANTYGGACEPLAHQPEQYVDTSVPLQMTDFVATTDGVIVSSPVSPLWSIHIWFDIAPHP